MEMTKEFIPYEQALALKELGFDEPCYKVSKHYKKCEENEKPGGCQLPNIYCAYPACITDKLIPLPLYQQAFRWFREKYDLVIEPCVPFQRLYSTEEDHFEILEFGYRIYSFDQYRGGLRDKIEWDGYDNSNEEEAELECLKKLIKIVTH